MTHSGNLSRLLVGLWLALLLTGCSTVGDWFSSDDDEANEPAELVDINTEVRIKKLWSTGAGGGQGKGFNDLEPIMRSVEAAGGRIVKPIFDFPGGKRFHFADPDGYVLAVWTLA